MGRVLIFMATLLATEIRGEQLSLKQLIELAGLHNPKTQAIAKSAQSAWESAKAETALADPMIGITELNRGNTTRYWTIAQRVDFPTKYLLRKKIQQTRAQGLMQSLSQEKLNLRATVITTYYGIYAVQKIKSLTEDDLTKIQEFSRIAETKYAAGTAPLQDSMKAHFTQTQVEADLIHLKQEEDILQARMAEAIGRSSPFKLTLGNQEPIVPRIPGDLSKLAMDSRKSPFIMQKRIELKTSHLANNLSKWQYAPDFQVRYQGYLSGDPGDSHMVTLELSLPVWFWGKSADERATVLDRASKEFELTAALQRLNADVQGLASRARNQSELLDIFRTSLIPQAVTSLDSSMDAYKANKITFLALLDSERSLLKVRIAYYKTLTTYIESLTQLEAAIGYTISRLGY